VAARWLADGHHVVGVVRGSQHAEELQREGIEPLIADVTRPESLTALPPAETVLYCVGHRPRDGGVRWAVYVDGLKAVLDVLTPATRRVIYASSTGVFGQTDGSWVDEDTPCRPSREAGQAFLAAEQLLAEHRLADRAIILRLAGLYGPGRLPRKTDLLAGKPIPAPSGGYLNLIHADDAAAVVMAAEQRAKPPRTYIVSDGHPVQRRTYYAGLAERLAVPLPRFIDPPPNAPVAVRATADKRASNERMVAELGVRLLYPSIDEFWTSADAASLG